ncbi:MAG: cytochrome P450 [Myxococcales bacterium]
MPQPTVPHPGREASAETSRVPPAPPGYPLVGHFPVLRDVLSAAERFRELGDVVKLRLPPYDVYLILHPDDLERFLVRDHELYRKDFTTRILEGLLGQGLLVNEGASWRAQRRIVQPEFTPRRVDSFVESMAGCTEPALGRFQSLQGSSVDLHAEMMRLTLDIAGRTLFGAETSEVAGEIGGLVERFLVHYLGFMSTGLRWPDWVPTPGNLRNRQDVARLNQIVQSIIDERRRAAQPGNDLLSRLIAARDEAGRPMSDSLLRNESITMLLAGHETTALLLTFCLMLVGQHPEVEARLVEELHQHAPGGRPSAAQLTQLTYMDIVLRESLRLYPPAYSIGREALVDTELGGYRIKKGDQVWAFQWVTQRDPRFFRDPSAFRPERWLGEETRDLPRFAYFPFGGGPRICPGAHFSLVEAKIVLVMLLSRFRFELESQAVPRLLPSVTIRPKGGLKARVFAR